MLFARRGPAQIDPDTNRKGRVRHIYLARPEEKYVCRKYSAGTFEIPVQVTFAFQVPFFE